MCTPGYAHKAETIWPRFFVKYWCLPDAVIVLNSVGDLQAWEVSVLMSFKYAEVPLETTVSFAFTGSRRGLVASSSSCKSKYGVPLLERSRPTGSTAQ
jgi:hypothetical protein